MRNDEELDVAKRQRDESDSEFVAVLQCVTVCYSVLQCSAEAEGLV